MRKTLILLIVLLLVTAPVLTSVLPAVCGADVASATGAQDGDDDAMSFWDWLVLWWTMHWDEWPV